MKFRSALIAAVGLLLLASYSFAQTSAIEGIVTGYDGQVVPNAVIKFIRTDMKANYQAKTDKKGRYIYMGLPVGSIFTVTVEIDGKEIDKTMNVRAGLGEPTSCNFDLRKAKATQEATSAALKEAAETGKISDELARKLTDEQKDAIKLAAKEREEMFKKNKELNDAFNAGMTALDAKQYADAVTGLTKASELDPKQSAVWANLGEAYMGNAGSKTGAERTAELQKAIDSYNKALEIKADDPALHNNYGRLLAQSGKPQEAQAEMSKAAQLDPPGAGKYFYNLGAILTNSGQADAAAEAFKKAMDINYGPAFYQYALYLVGKASIDASGNVKPAEGTVEAFQKYLQVDPNGQFAADAKAMIESLGAKVDTSYKNPNAPEKKSTGKKK